MRKENNKTKHFIMKQKGLFFASRLYAGLLKDIVSEQNYYKILERMVAKEEIGKISKGIYYVINKGKYGIIKPNTDDIVNTFTSNENGIVIGYNLYNKYGITTQVAKKTEIYSSVSTERVRKIGNILIKRYNIKFSEEIKSMIEALEIAENYYHIQDINIKAFLSYTKNFAKKYNEAILENVLNTITYKKSTLAFIKNILDYYNIKNDVNRYYSSLSKFKSPTMEEIVEAV